MSEITPHTIDVDRLLGEKLGGRSALVPRFVRSWLKRVIHQDEVNAFIWDARDKTGVDWLEQCLRYLDVRLDLRGIDNLPPDDDGRLYTFVSNHPLGGADGVALGALLGRRYGGRLRYLVNDLLMNLPGLAPLCIPINKTGRQGRDFPALVEAGFKGDNHIIMFPAGLCSRRIGGEIQDLPWRKTFIVKSVETGRDIVPIHFGGRNSDRFYTIANICSRLGLKVNLAMLFLVDEMYRNTHKTFTVTVGKPIPWQTFDRTRKPQEWADHVRQQVYRLAQEP